MTKDVQVLFFLQKVRVAVSSRRLLHVLSGGTTQFGFRTMVTGLIEQCGVRNILPGLVMPCNTNKASTVVLTTGCRALAVDALVHSVSVRSLCLRVK